LYGQSITDSWSLVFEYTALNVGVAWYGFAHWILLREKGSSKRPRKNKRRNWQLP
jgi:hypothetical protein